MYNPELCGPEIPILFISTGEESKVYKGGRLARANSSVVHAQQARSICLGFGDEVSQWDLWLNDYARLFGHRVPMALETYSLTQLR